MEDDKSMGRKEKRKAMKKMKRKQTRKEAAERERREEEDRLNDPEEQRRMQLLEEEEAERMRRDTILFQEREKAFMDMIITRQLQQQQQQQEGEQEQSIDHNHEFECVVQDEGPPEIIWQGNEIIFKKKQVRVRVPDTHNHNNHSQQHDDIRPTSNPLPPESESRTQDLQDVAQQIPNFGTEQDKAHCPFHLKTGACRFGERCSRVHFIPDKSSTLLFKNMYNGPGLACDRDQDEGLEVCSFTSSFISRFILLEANDFGLGCSMLKILAVYTDEEIDRCFEGFYEDVHTEFLKFGEIVNFKVCKNGSFHLRGNVYVQYKALDSALLLASNLKYGCYFVGKQVTYQFVNLTRWKVAICGEYMKSGFKTCSHGTACNFIHCFRNPGGDYEWADSDKPPPKFWVEKMIALFGYSDDYEASRDQGNFSLLKTHSDRYHCRRSSREMDQISCGHSGRRKHEDERKQRTPNEYRNASLKNTNKRKSRGRTADTDSDREWLEKEDIREKRHEYTRNGSFNKDRDENSRSHEEDSDVDCDTRDNEKQHGREGRNPRKCDKDIRVWINEAAGLDGDRDVRRHRIRESSGHQSGVASESDKAFFGRVEMETLHDYSRKISRNRRWGVQDVYKKKRSK